MTDARTFRGFRCPAEVILWAVRWYLRFGISYRDLEHMLVDRHAALTPGHCGLPSVVSRAGSAPAVD